MRNLKSTDLFAALRIVREVGVKEEMKAFAARIADKSLTEENQREIGVEFLWGLLGNAGTEKAEKAVYEFLAGPMEYTVQELRDMDLIEFGKKIVEFVGSVDIEDWKAFFTQVAELMKKMRS